MEEHEYIRRLQLKEVQLSAAIRTAEDQLRRANHEKRSHELKYQRRQGAYERVQARMQALRQSTHASATTVKTGGELKLLHRQFGAARERIRSAGQQVMQAGKALSAKKGILQSRQQELKGLQEKRETIVQKHNRKNVQMRLGVEGSMADELQSLAASMERTGMQQSRFLKEGIGSDELSGDEYSTDCEFREADSLYESQSRKVKEGVAFESEHRGGMDGGSRHEQQFEEHPGQHSEQYSGQHHSGDSAVAEHAFKIAPEQYRSSQSFGAAIANTLFRWLKRQPIPEQEVVDLSFSMQSGEACNLKVSRDEAGELEIAIVVDNPRRLKNLKGSQSSILRDLKEAGYGVSKMNIIGLPPAKSRNAGV